MSTVCWINGDVPLRQVLGGHGQLAGGEHPAPALLGRRVQRPERVAEITAKDRSAASAFSLVSVTLFIPSGVNTRLPSNVHSGIPLTFSTIAPAIT